MKPVTILTIKNNTNPKFIKTQAVTYERGDTIAVWEKTKVHNTTHILVKNIDTDELLLVKQTRIPVLVEQPETHGVTIEATAGIIDCYPDFANEPAMQARMAASAEIREELGYLCEPETLIVLPTYIGSTGGSGSTCYPFYCEVTNDQFVGQHLEDDEDIEIFPIQAHKIHIFLENTTNIDATTRYLLYWYLATQAGSDDSEEHN